LERKKNILITRPYEEGKKLANLFNEELFNTILFPTIKTIPLEPNFDLEKVLDFDIFVFGSGKAVKYFFERFPIEYFFDKEFIAVGEKTANRLKSLGLKKVIYPKDEYTSEAVLKLIENKWDYYKDKKILFPKSKIGTKTLEEKLPNVVPMYIYTTITNYPKNREEVKRILLNGEMDFIIFSSPSTIEGFKNNFPEDWKKFINSSKIVAIGRITANKLKNENITNFVLPKKATNEEIQRLILREARYLC